MNTTVVAAFPGCGKSSFFNTYGSICLDSDSSNFSWLLKEDGTKERHPEFPANYINHIKENLGKVKWIFVSSHDVVRDALSDNKINFFLVYPSIDRKSEFLQNYKDRGSPDSFINLLDNKWEDWIRECNNYSSPYCIRAQMFDGFLADELEVISQFNDTEETDLDQIFNGINLEDYVVDYSDLIGKNNE